MEDKIFFNAGDVVQLRLEIPNKPMMVVVKKESAIFKKDNKDSNLKGIRCMWFTTTGELLESIFNTKDLLLINKSNNN